MRSLIVVLLVSAAALYGCTETTINPSPVVVTITTGPPMTVTADPPVAAVGTIELDPLNFTVSVGKNVNVTVTVKDTDGNEVDTENLTVEIVDDAIVSLVEKTNRTLAFEGNEPGSTPIIISANGLQTATTGTVIR